MKVLNLGAGVQSTVLYLMATAGKLPCDYAVFADTGDEGKETYKHLRWLQTLPGPPILVRTKGVLGDDLVKGSGDSDRFASIPAYTMTPGEEEEGRVRRQCSKEYKVEVIERTIRREILGLKPRQRVPKGTGLVQYIGISIDEAGRSVRIRRRRKLGKIQFPLIERFMTRDNCVSWLVEFAAVPHEVPSSSCVYCPFHDDAQWLRIKAVPEDWARAVAVDEALRAEGTAANRGLKAKLYVHRSCVPLAEVAFNPKSEEDRQGSMPFWRECLGVCGA